LLVLVATVAAGGGGSGAGGAGGSAGGLLPALDLAYRPSGKAAAGEVFVHLFDCRWADIARE
jgi:alpha-amylase